MKRGFYWKLAFQNLKNNRRIYVPFLLSSIGIIMMFYIIQSISLSIDAEGLYGGRTISTMMNLGTIVIGIFAVLFLFYTNSFIMKRRKKELGLYNILGMEKFHIGKIIFRESLITTFTALFLGLGLGILFSRAMFLLLEKILGVDLHIAFSVPPAALLATLLLFLTIFFVTMLYNILQVRLAKPIELLHGSDMGEKEPKAHWLLAVLGVACLGTGYGLAVTIQDPVEALMFFFIAVILVIFGTYLLFITGITALLQLLKKKKSFYYKANHFTTVSGMLYRMKQNAAGLASICILFTCLLVTVSTTFSLYSSMEDMIRERFPRDISISMQDVRGGDTSVAEKLAKAAVQEESTKLGLTVTDPAETIFFYENVMFRNGNQILWNDVTAPTGSYVAVSFCKLSDFNRLSGRNETLGENEVLMMDPGHVFPESGTLLLGNKELAYRPLDYEFVDGDHAAIMAESLYLVVPGPETIQDLLDYYYDEPGSAGRPRYTYQFNVEGGKSEDIAALGKALAANLEEASYDTETDEYRLSFSQEDVASNTSSYYELYGGLFFLGIFLGLLFLMGTVMIIYYKQVSEGYEDAKRFSIMQKVGMSRREVKKSIHSQILLVFFLPLLTAVLHLCFAFPMLQKILMMMGLVNTWVILGSTIGCVAIFGAVYAVVYAITARTYYKIVETAE